MGWWCRVAVCRGGGGGVAVWVEGRVVSERMRRWRRRRGVEVDWECMVGGFGIGGID